MNYFIITGASRGIGEALTHRLIEPGSTLFVASRTMNEDLVEYASSLNVPLYYFETDLSNRESAELFIRSVFTKIELKDGDKIALINNAGMLEPIAPLGLVDFKAVEIHLRLNLLSPIILSSVFLAETASYEGPKVILNISSGASTIPFSGWSAYCSSKASMDMFTKVAGLEQKSEQFPAIVFALAPGIIETGMQELIRNTDESLFPEKNSFIKLFQEGKLAKPQDVAQIITRALFSTQIETGSVLTIDQLKEIQ
jgi:benzil reductase ((S)-benzoin forming)